LHTTYIVHLFRHMKTHSKAADGRDEDRQPNELGASQMEQLAGVLSEEGTKFDLVLYSPVARARLLAERIADGAELVPMAELYDPNPEGTDKNEVLEATLLLKGTDVFGYDLAGWFGSELVVMAMSRRAEKVKDEITRRASTLCAEKKRIVHIGVVGHYAYLNMLAERLAPSQVGLSFRQTALKECDRFVIPFFEVDNASDKQHIPLGQKFELPN